MEKERGKSWGKFGESSNPKLDSLSHFQLKVVGKGDEYQYHSTSTSMRGLSWKSPT